MTASLAMQPKNLMQDESTNVDPRDETGILQPDAIVASQFSDVFRGHAQPERNLMVAVLEDAVRCFQLYRNATDPSQRALYGDAKKWIRSRNHTWFFSFENICTALGIDPGYLRSGLLASEAASRERDTSSSMSRPSTDTEEAAHNTVERAQPAASKGQA